MRETHVKTLVDKKYYILYNSNYKFVAVYPRLNALCTDKLIPKTPDFNREITTLLNITDPKNEWMLETRDVSGQVYFIRQARVTVNKNFNPGRPIKSIELMKNRNLYKSRLSYVIRNMKVYFFELTLGPNKRIKSAMILGEGYNFYSKRAEAMSKPIEPKCDLAHQCKHRELIVRIDSSDGSYVIYDNLIVAAVENKTTKTILEGRIRRGIVVAGYHWKIVNVRPYEVDRVNKLLADRLVCNAGLVEYVGTHDLF